MHTTSGPPRRYTMLAVLIVCALLAPLLSVPIARADAPWDAVARRALADVGLPEPITDAERGEQEIMERGDQSDTLHTFCTAMSAEEGLYAIACRRWIWRLLSSATEDYFPKYICEYNLTAAIIDLTHPTVVAAQSEEFEMLRRLATEGWSAVLESGEMAEMAEMLEAGHVGSASFTGGTMHTTDSGDLMPGRRHRQAIWGDERLIIWTTSEERVYRTVQYDDTARPCEFGAFHADPTPEELLEAIHRAAAVPAAAVEPEPNPTPAALQASCDLSFHPQSPLILRARLERDGQPLSDAAVTVQPIAVVEGVVAWEDLVALYDDVRDSWVQGELGARTDTQGEARLAIRVAHGEAPRPIMRGRPLRGIFALRVEGDEPLETTCAVAIDYVAVAHQSVGPLLLFRYGADEPAVALSPGTRRSEAFPLYLGDRVVLGHDPRWTRVYGTELDASTGERVVLGHQPQPDTRSATLLLTYIDGTRAQFRVGTLQDERLEVREGDLWHDSRAEFMIGATRDRDEAGAMGWFALQLASEAVELAAEHKIQIILYGTNPIGWKAAVIPWAIVFTGKVAIDALGHALASEEAPATPTPGPEAPCSAGQLFDSNQYGEVMMREPWCEQLVPTRLIMRSLIEIEADEDGLRIRTHEGDPEVRHGDGAAYALPPGQEVRVDPVGRGRAPEPFTAGERWWDAAVTAPLGETPTEGTYTWDIAADVSDPTGAPEAQPAVVPAQREGEGSLLGWLLAAGLCGLLAIGTVLGVLLLARRGKRRQTAVTEPPTRTARPAPAAPPAIGAQPTQGSAEAPDTWWLARGAERHGPYTWAQLAAAGREGRIHPDDLIHDPRIGQWRRAAEYEELIAGR